jgi:hypothetical protein
MKEQNIIKRKEELEEYLISVSKICEKVNNFNKYQDIDFKKFLGVIIEESKVDFDTDFD